MTSWLLIFAYASIVFCIGWLRGRNSMSVPKTDAEKRADKLRAERGE
jgi:hypothetical protein